MFSEGISRGAAIIDLGVKYGIVSRQGSWLSYGEVRIGQGREAGKLFLKENPKLMQEIEDKIKQAAEAEALSKAAKSSKAKPKAAIEEAEPELQKV